MRYEMRRINGIDCLFVGEPMREHPVLATGVARALADLREDLPPDPFVEGPDFVYEMAPSLFLGRQGRGPLDVVWDTNILIEYFQHGRALWDNDSLPDLVPGDLGEQLEALQVVMAVWEVREIRFHILPFVLDDAKKRLTDDRRSQRWRALREFASALSLGGWDDPDVEDPSPPLVLPTSVSRNALRRLPVGNDRVLVEGALARDAHVFLTMDKKVLRCREQFGRLGLLLASPCDLLDELAVSGAMNCLVDPGVLRWPIPDLERVSHLIAAFGGAPSPS